MGHLETGYYAPANRHRVTVWPAPDADGDGEQVWDEQYGPNGEPMGRRAAKDANGKDVFRYEPPEGFIAVHTAQPGANDPGVSYVRADERGRVWRHPRTGEAAGIVPGSVLIEKPNGDFELLTDEYSQYLYAKAHDKADAPADDSLVVPPDDSERVQAERDAQDREDFEAWRAERQRESAATLERELRAQGPENPSGAETGEASLAADKQGGEKQETKTAGRTRR